MRPACRAKRIAALRPRPAGILPTPPRGMRFECVSPPAPNAIRFPFRFAEPPLASRMPAPLKPRARTMTRPVVDQHHVGTARQPLIGFQQPQTVWHAIEARCPGGQARPAPRTARPHGARLAPIRRDPCGRLDVCRHAPAQHGSGAMAQARAAGPSVAKAAAHPADAGAARAGAAAAPGQADAAHAGAFRAASCHCSRPTQRS